jgi:glycosyltransferase involved in cell wall biosynthesis
MRVAIMLQSLHHRGGIGTYTQQIVRHLLALDRRNEYVLIYPPFGQARTSFDAFAAYDNVTRVLSDSLVPHGYYWDHVVVPRVARRHGIDLVFNPFVSIPLVGSFRRVFVMHGSEWFLMPEVFWWLERWIGRRRVHAFMRVADVVISVSQKVANDLISATGLPEAKFRVVHNAPDDTFRPVTDERVLADVRRRYGLPDAFMLFVGGIYPQKNFGGLLRAFRQVAPSIPHRLVVAGNMRWKSEGDLALIRTLGLQDRVQLLGWVEPVDLPALYSLAGCFVLPSFHESCSVALLEAMACGCPVIASRTGGNPEVVRDAAVLIDPGDPAQLTDAIRAVLGDEERRSDLRRRGQARAKDFSWETSARQTLDIFRELG